MAYFSINTYVFFNTENIDTITGIRVSYKVVVILSSPEAMTHGNGSSRWWVFCRFIEKNKKKKSYLKLNDFTVFF